MANAGYIEQFLTSFGGGNAKGPGIAKINLPDVGSLSGILASEVNISLQNRFGPLIPDLSFLTELSSMLGGFGETRSLFSWIGATAQSWKGTEPIRFGMDLYFVNYKPGLDLEGKLKKLAGMCAIDSTSTATVTVHGGYQGRYFGGNESQQFFHSKEALDNLRTASDENRAQYSYELLHNVGEAEFQSDIKGVVSVQIGSRFMIDNLLITRVDITPSLVEVYNAGNPKPLYYKVGVSFQTCRAALSTDVDLML